MDIFDGFIEATIRTSTPLLLASLGALFTAQSGVINMAMEGIMISGCFFGMLGSHLTGNPVMGALMGMLGGLIAAMILGLTSITFKVNQVVAGTGINALFLGLTSFLLNTIFGPTKPSRVTGFSVIEVPVLSEIPILGAFFRQNVLTWIAFALVFVATYVIKKTSFGLSLRAVGQQPHAADSLGISVNKMRYISVIIAGLLGGLGGVSLSLGQLNVFMENMTSGRGYIAWSTVTVGRHSPLGILGASSLFGGAEALQVRLQAAGVEIPHQLVSMLPYVLTIVVLVSVVRRSTSPRSMGKPFIKGERNA